MTAPRFDYAKHAYPYIVAWGRRIGSSQNYIETEVANAQRRKAPRDAWACHGNDDIKLARNLASNNMFRDWLEIETGIPIEEQAKK